MGTVEPIGKRFQNPKALCAAILERDDIEWCVVSFQTKTGVTYYECKTSLAELALVGVTLSAIAASGEWK
jgi:hypothetical protein